MLVDEDGSTIWAVVNSAVYRYHRGEWASIRMPNGGGVSSLLSKGLLTVSVNGTGVYQIGPRRLKEYDHKDGLLRGGGILVSPSLDGVIVTRNKGPALSIVDGNVEPIGFPPDWNTPTQRPFFVALANGECALFNNLSKYGFGLHAYRLLPSIRSQSGEWRKIKNSPWGEGGMIYHFCEVMSDGSSLVGTRHGLMTIEGDALVRAEIFSEQRDINSILECTDQNEFWMTEWYGDLL